MRPTKHQSWMHVAGVVARRSTCPRRQVGAVIVDADSHVLSTGHNGVPRGVAHCIDVSCPGAADQSGDTSRCIATHAEMNAIAWCHDRRAMHTLYTTTSPCFACCKLITATPIKQVVICEPYPDVVGLHLLAQAGITVSMLQPTGEITELYPNK